MGKKNNSVDTQPNRKIKAVVDMMFDDISYSDEVNEAQPKIEAVLNTEFDKIKADKHEDEALEELLGRYGKLSQMAELAGYPADSADKWRKEGEAQALQPLRKEITKQRIRVYRIALFLSATLLQLFWLIHDIAVRPRYAVGDIGFISFWLLCAYIPFKRYHKTEKEAEGNKYDTEAYKYLRRRSDKYTKRLLNSIALLFAMVFLILIAEIFFYIYSNSKPAEFNETAFINSIAVEIPVFILLKNILCLWIFQRRIKIPDISKYGKHVRGIIIFSAVYWIGATIFSVIYSSKVIFPMNILPVVGILFAILLLIYDLTLRKKITYRNIEINRLRIAVFTSAIIAVTGFTFIKRDRWYTQTYINSVPVVQHNTHKISYDEDTGVYTITKTTDDFKILHLTDIHIGGSLYSYPEDLKALRACYAEIEHSHPDLVIVTGDMCFPMGIMSMSLNNSAPVQQFAAFMRNTGIPWAFTYGNHDTENMSTLNKTELNEVYKSLSYKTSANLLYPYVQPDIMGRNNQLIELRNSDGSLNTGLFLIDSNAYTGEGLNVYDYIHDDQVDWYADEVQRLNAEAGHTVNSLLFFHIPLQEYKTATELYLEGSNEVKHYFGENPGDHGGITNNLVCCSEYPSKLFDTAVELGSTTGMFCGHDHYNNASLEYKGIRLTYGMSIDYLAMPGIDNETKQRGAELITIHSDSTWDLEQIPLESIS
ncbi:metallophosphoesterase [Ruminococcus albus]|uniref:Calcineurin-like phosphoesterase n=1 Tax=Ruminococcus albus TaxID=1264 RepID=A0A1H7IYC3_RUMAL|nr:metallophosphoesterase [Ruminococcus albus]SEK66670.1 Calcineurin-like phosphoesterase [Ruminococcus albus]